MRNPELRGLLAAAGVAVLGALAMVVPGAPALLTVPAAVLLALVLPGYVLQRLLFSRVRLDPAERLAMTIALSMVLAILGGFVLDASTGITAPAWGALLGGLTLVFAAVAILRRPAAGGHAASEPAAHPGQSLASLGEPWAGAAAPVRRPVSGLQAGMLVLAAILALGAFAVAAFGLVEQPRAGYTELWLNQLSAGAVQLGITDHEGSDTTYRLVITVDGKALGDPTSVTVASEGTLHETVDLPPASRGAQAPLLAPARSREVDVQLFTGQGGDQPYREVRLTVRPPSSPAPAGSPTPTRAP
jgi:uncharacterized membrane protein